MKEFPLAYPDFLQSPVWNRRDPLYEELIRADMMERRMVLDIPEFYVGSIVAVTLADKNLESHQRRFLGICIRREKQGLHSTFTLRNVYHGLGIEIMYDLYSPDIQKIEVIKLERRLDNDLSYLKDALPKYSTFDPNMEPVQHVAGKEIELNPLKVVLKPQGWTKRWELSDAKGIDERSVWEMLTPFWKKRFILKTKDKSFHKYDLIRNYRELPQEREYEQKVMAEMIKFEEEKERKGIKARRKILKAMSKKHTYNFVEE